MLQYKFQLPDMGPNQDWSGGNYPGFSYVQPVDDVSGWWVFFVGGRVASYLCRWWACTTYSVPSHMAS